jgi:hypothetical protein
VDLKVDDEGDGEDLKGFKSGLESFQCVCVELICVWMLLICISWESIVITRNSKKQSHSIEFYKVDHAGGMWFFIKLVKQSMGSWSVCVCVCVCVCVFYVLSIWGGDVMNTGLCNLFGLKGLYYKM